MTITNAPAAVQGIFALDILTAGFAALLLVAQVAFLLASKSRRRSYSPVAGKGSKHHSPTGTYAWIIPGTVLLCLTYAAASASVALSAGRGGSIEVTQAYSYYYNQFGSTSSSPTGTIFRLSFLQALALILTTTLLTGAVWLHSAHVTSNGTGKGEPSFKSILWNTFILCAMLGTGLASWGEAISLTGGGARYGQVLRYDRVSRALYITFRCCVIAASTSVSIEVWRRYSQVKATGLPGNSERPILARLAFYAVPIFALRNAFLVVDIVMLYVSPQKWSYASREAIAFLLVIFGQLADLTIFAIVSVGARSMGKAIQ